MNEKEKIIEKTIVVCIGAMICCFLWGSAFPCIKIGYELTGIDSADSASQILYAGMRFTLAGIFAVIIGSLLRKHVLFPRLAAWPKVAALSLFQTIIQYVFFYIGLAHTSGVKASIIEGTSAFVAIIIAAVIFRQEKITMNKLIGCVVGFAGVVLVNITGSGLDMSLSFMGEGFIFLSTVAYSFSSVFLKSFSKTEDPVMLSGYQFIFGGIVMMLIGSLLGGHVSIASTAAAMMLVYLALVSAVAYSLWGILLKYNPVSKVAVFGFMNPVFGVILSSILLKEGDLLGLKAIAALILVCLGIYTVNRKESL